MIGENSLMEPSVSYAATAATAAAVALSAAARSIQAAAADAPG